ncbi:MAG: hypothetical protein IT189_07780 [Microbacteriaceae bacterium]|jgi:hypothetical protein|nr:hypothetical protein [Actinomycetota bacterium]MCC6855945.1 hypothetical protein [Microbacteriaceae bacterium]HOT34167.1 hypothetical protein [Rhodoglobus sp.]HQJ35672.1 hypothetical protein [Rhodoglobus sp.]
MTAPRTTGPADNDRYEIRIRGQLDAQWSDWFEGFALTVSDDQTILTGRISDQAALHGLLRRIGNLGLTLVSVTQLTATPLNQNEGEEP